MAFSSEKPSLTIAIDGPAAAGKSSVARAIAARLGLTYVDTGAMYRALTLKALRAGVSPEDEAGLAALAAKTTIEFRPAPDEGGQQTVLLDGRDVTREIRSRDVDMSVSPVSRHPAVRAWFREAQRAMARAGGVVMEGRDIGTVVLPTADRKFFLDGTLEERSRRRFRELRGKGFAVDEELVRQDIARRDAIDSTREAAPLAIAGDAIRIDTTHKTLAEVIDEVARLSLARGGTA